MVGTDTGTKRSILVRVGLVGLVLATTLGSARVARAEGPSAADEARADAIFQRANEKVARKDFAGACPLFEEAYRIAGGGGTAQSLATCLEDQGRLAAAYHAYAELRRISVPAGRLDRVKLAEERMAKLEGRVARVHVRLAQDLRTPDTLVTVDGDTYGDRAIEAGVPVDVGTHVVKVMVPGKTPLERSVTIQRDGQSEEVALPYVEKPPAPVVERPRESDADVSRASVRTAGLVIGGLGVSSLFVGGLMGILAATSASSARGACRDGTPDLSLSNKGPYDDPTKMFDAGGRCYTSTPERPNPFYENAARYRADAQGYGTLSTLLVPVGIAGIVVGTYMLLSSRTDRPAQGEGKPKVTARIVPGPLGLSVAGEMP